jgi:hypothetical protein
MKNRHNKKRNIAFVYEVLVKEATVAVLREEKEKKTKIVNLIRKHFNSKSLLYKELMCYRSLYENQNLERGTSEKIAKEAKIAQRLIDPDGLFKQQTDLIKDVNKELSPRVFNNFVPNYKTLATIAQLFSHKLSPKDTVILENQLIDNMTKKREEQQDISTIDATVIKEFVTKFNEKYSDELLLEQKELLAFYISSFADNSLELKMFLNEEIERLKNKLIEAKSLDEINTDENMGNKTDKIIDKLNSFSSATINDDVLATVMKTQQLVKEIYDDVDSN